MPSLSITRRPALDRRRETQRFSDSTKMRRFCRLGKKRRFVLLFAWETLLPTIGPFPVTWQTRAIFVLLKISGIGKKESISKNSRLFNDLRKTIVSCCINTFNNLSMRMYQVNSRFSRLASVSRSHKAEIGRASWRERVFQDV